MKPQELLLRCYAEKEPDGSWFGMCVDFNLAAQADSLMDVKFKLHAMINDYLEEALGEDRQYAADLLLRRAPLYFWFKYHLIHLLTYIRRRKDCDSGCQFSETLPLKPA